MEALGQRFGAPRPIPGALGSRFGALRPRFGALGPTLEALEPRVRTLGHDWEFWAMIGGYIVYGGYGAKNGGFGVKIWDSD